MSSMGGWRGSPQAGLLRSPSGRRLTEATPLLPRRRSEARPAAAAVAEAGEGWLEGHAASLAASGAPELLLILTDL